MAGQRGLNLTQLVGVPNVWNYAIAPDSERAAVVWDKPGTSQIYLVPLKGGRARQITRGSEAAATDVKEGVRIARSLRCYWILDQLNH